VFEVQEWMSMDGGKAEGDEPKADAAPARRRRG
jgi:hypothetical protein